MGVCVGDRDARELGEAREALLVLAAKLGRVAQRADHAPGAAVDEHRSGDPMHEAERVAARLDGAAARAAAPAQHRADAVGKMPGDGVGRQQALLVTGPRAHVAVRSSSSKCRT